MTASAAASTTWAVTIPGAVLCAYALVILLRLLGRRWVGLAGAMVVAGLAVAIAGSAVVPAAAAAPLLLVADILFGIGLLLVGLSLAPRSNGAPGRRLRPLKFLLLASGGCFVSFALFPLGVLFLAAALVLAAPAFAERVTPDVTPDSPAA